MESTHDLTTATAEPFDERAWVHTAARLAWKEVLVYLRTLGGIAFRPARFALAWRAGERTMNPLGFVATSAGVSAVVLRVTQSLTALPGYGADSALAIDLARAAGPYVYLAALGALVHLVLRLAGSRRPVHGSVAMALYAGGGPGLASLFYFAIVAAMLVMTTGYDVQAGLLPSVPPRLRVPALIVFLVADLWQYVGLARALGSLHGARWYWTVLGLVGALLVLAVFLGFLTFRCELYGAFGWLHPVLWWVDGQLKLDVRF